MPINPQVPSPDEIGIILAQLAFFKKVILWAGAGFATCVIALAKWLWNISKLHARFEAVEADVQDMKESNFLNEEQVTGMREHCHLVMTSQIDAKVHSAVEAMRHDQSEIKVNLYLLMGKFGLNPVSGSKVPRIPMSDGDKGEDKNN